MATIATVRATGVDTRDAYIPGTDHITVTTYPDGYVTIGGPQAEMPALFRAMAQLIDSRNRLTH